MIIRRLAGGLCSRLLGWLLGCVLISFPWAVQANVIWPPAVYFYTLAVWWVVAVGLLLEFVAHFLVLRMPVVPLTRIVVASNFASALIGFVLTWPLVFWESGVTQLAAMAPSSIFLVLFIIFALNIAIEYAASVRRLKLQKSNSALGSFIIANALSYGFVIWVALSGILSGA